MLSIASCRVRQPQTFAPARIVVGELHLVRRRLEATLAVIGELVGRGGGEEAAWGRVEEAVRLARRALVAANQAAPAARGSVFREGELRVGELRIDVAARRQWFGEAEVELTPIQHRLLVVMAAAPYRVYGKDELLREVWRRGVSDQTNAVNTTVSRVRRSLVQAGARPGAFMRNLHGTGWALTHPE